MPKRRITKIPLNTVGNADTGLATKQDLYYYATMNNNIDNFECEPAEVLDIILNSTHPDYSVPDDIGKVRVRLLYSEQDVGYDRENWNSTLSLAKPLNPAIKYYPLLHEIVLCYYYPTNATGVNDSSDDSNMIPDVLYYDNVLNANNSIIQNSLTDISLSHEFKNSNTYINPELNGLFGKNFIGNMTIKPLSPNEGDLIIEGRTGNSIRIGSNNGSGEDPILIIRNNQSKLVNENDIIITEDINNDGSSIWFSVNTNSPLEFASNNWGQITTLGDYKEDQIIVNSNRIILNSKYDNLMFSSKNSALISAENEISLGSKYITTNSDYVFLGKYENCQPAVLGNTLISILYELVGSIATLTVSNAAGISTPPINASNFIKIMNKLNTLVSKKTFLE